MHSLITLAEFFQPIIGIFDQLTDAGVLLFRLEVFYIAIWKVLRLHKLTKLLDLKVYEI